MHMHLQHKVCIRAVCTYMGGGGCTHAHANRLLRTAFLRAPERAITSYRKGTFAVDPLTRACGKLFTVGEEEVQG